MRHGKKFNHLGRTSTHRKAMLSNMATSLIINKRITTTVAKAKALRKYVEPLITKSKTDTTQSRRIVFSYLQDKTSSQVLFSEVAEKVADRPGGYTRIIKLGGRLGDNAEMALIELVDFNDLYTQGEEKAKTRTRRSRRGGKKKSESSADQTDEAAVAVSGTSEATADEVASETILDSPPAADEDSTEVGASSTSAATEEDVPAVADETLPDEPVIEVEVKEGGDVIELSGEAVVDVDEPVVIEETTDETSTDDPAASADEEDNDDQTPKDKA